MPMYQFPNAYMNEDPASTPERSGMKPTTTNYPSEIMVDKVKVRDELNARIFLHRLCLSCNVNVKKYYRE